MADEEDKLKDKTSDFRQKVKTRTMLAFGVVGFLVDFFFTINISASQDILEATKIPTSLVLLAVAGLAYLTTVVYPYFFTEDSSLSGIMRDFLYHFRHWNAQNVTRSSVNGETFRSVHGVIGNRLLRHHVLSINSFLWRKHGKQLCSWHRKFTSSGVFVVRR